LMELLSQEDPDIVTWLPSGKAFVVRCPKKFVELVLPRFFKQTRITSFQRQLNMYGFRRIADGPDMGAYHHERFVRDKPHLCSTIQRKKRIRKRSVPKSALPLSVKQPTSNASVQGLELSTSTAQSFSPSIELPSSTAGCTTTADTSQNKAQLHACQSIYPPSSPVCTAEPLPSLDHSRTPSRGCSIFVCDHATKSIVEVAHYATIPCDLDSFALGVGELLADGIEQYKTSCTDISVTYPSNPLIRKNHDMLQNHGDYANEYSEEELDVDICNIFQNEAFGSLYMTAC
jgi:hypothetical protein